jgi:putative transposase
LFCLPEGFSHRGWGFRLFLRFSLILDQGSQFTSLDFTQVLKDADSKISMDGRGRWMDNVMIDRLWRSLKYECVYLHAFETESEARNGIGNWMDYYNQRRPHSSLDGRTPDEAYWGLPMAGPSEAAA